MTVRVAVIGAGIMGSDHASLISEDIAGATVRVVCDVSEDAARRLAESCGAHDIATDAPSVIERNDVDAVLIASPDRTHADLALAALAARKPALCEKPLAATPEDCLRVVRAEEKTGSQLIQVGFMRRFDPAYVRMRSALMTGRLGDPLMMHNFHRNVEAPAGFTGLMAITNSAPHEFDAIRFVLGTEVTAITAFEASRPDPGKGRPVVMVLETSGNQLATVEINNNASYGYDVRGELVGTVGSVSIGNNAPSSVDEGLSSSTEYPADWRPRFAEAYRLQNKAWIRAISSGKPSDIASNAWDGYCATAIAEAGTRSLQSGQRAFVELAKRPVLYDRLGTAA